MNSRLTGMGLLTHVQHPLERLGDMVEAERQRQRALIVAERWRIARACLAGGSVGVSIFGTAVVSYAMLTSDTPSLAETAPSLAVAEAQGPPAPPPVLAPEEVLRPVIWSRAESDAQPASFAEVAALDASARPQPGISLQAQAMASFGEPLPRDADAMPTLAADVSLEPAEVAPQAVVQLVSLSLDEIAPEPTLVVSGLPQGSRVQHGVDVGDGTIVIPGDRSSDIDVKLPDDVREPVKAEVEMIGPDGTRASGFALTIRPSSGSPSRTQRALRANDDDDEPKKPRRKKRARSAEAQVQAQAQAQAQMQAQQDEARGARGGDLRYYPVEPSYLGRGDNGYERRARRDPPVDDGDLSLSKPRRPDADEETRAPASKSWGVFGLFGN